MTRIVAFDTETYPIGPGAVAPKLVCASLAARDDAGDISTALIGNHPGEPLLMTLRSLLQDEDTLVVTHAGEYDYTVLAAAFPELIPAIFAAMLAGRCTDTVQRERLLNLSMTGRLEQLKLPDGSSTQISYSLAALEAAYCGRDRTQAKEDLEESWRLHFSVLDGVPAAEYPPDAAAYAQADASGTLEVYEAQEQRKVDFPMASTATEGFQLASAFALRLMTCHGMEVNPEATAEMRRALEERLGSVEQGLVDAGLLRPRVPSAPHKNQLKKAHAIAGADPVWYEWRDELEAAGIKFTAEKKSSIDETAVQTHVAALYQRLGEVPDLTDGGASGVQQIKVDAEVQEYLATKDPVMALYHQRQSVKKLVDQLAILESGPVIYPNYNALVETGRTSSYGSKKGRPALYPSCNIQNVPNEIEDLDPRRCYRPREGRVFFDVDGTNLELADVGQITYDLFGASVHLERYNAGVDLHGYLGAQLAVTLATQGLALEFQQSCRAEGILDDPMAVYEAFALCKKSTEASVRAWYKEARNFAKPVGLGFPGGLGAETMVEFARKTYGIQMTVEQAYAFREVWHATYPEMPLFFDWVNSQLDEYNVDDHGEQLHWYETPLGMIRRGASYCAAANGKAMQSPGAEGMKIALINVQRECYDPTQESVLYGCRPIVFLHDQIVGETTLDEALWHDQCMRVRNVMCESMKHVLPDIKFRSDEAHLTSVWTKASEPMFGEDGKLIPWRPSGGRA